MDLETVKKAIAEKFREKTAENAPERLALARQLATGDYNAMALASSLHAPEIDGYTPAWLDIVSFAYTNPDNDDFNLRKAYDLQMIAALNGGDDLTFAPETIGFIHQYEMDPVQNHDAAIFWLEKAMNIEVRAFVAARKIASTFAENDRRFDPDTPPQDEDIAAYVLNKLDFAIAQGNEKALLLKGEMLLQGKGVEKDEKQALAFLKRAIVRAKERQLGDSNNTVYIATRLLLMHKLTSGSTIAEKIILKADASLLYRKERSSFPARESKNWDLFFSLRTRSPYREIIDLCCDFAQGRTTQEQLANYMKPYSEQEHRTNFYRILLLYSRFYHKQEKQKTWLPLLHLMENAEHDMTEERVIKNTQDTGPRYNPLDENGRTILGVWERAAAASFEKPESGSYVPAAGDQTLDGIYTDEKGRIHFQTTPSTVLPAKLLPEDFDVALALIFGDPEKKIFPVFDLPFADNYPDKSEIRLHRKIWNPAWLYHTAMGKSLFAADALAGNITFSPLKVPVGTPEQSITLETPELAKVFLTNIHYTSGTISDFSGNRVMLNPERVDGPSSMDTAENGTACYRISNITAKMRIDGEEQELTERGPPVTLNDTYYRFPRLTQRLTDQFQALERYAPLFQRAKEIAKLLNALSALREGGYKPPEEFQKEITQNLKKYSAAPPLNEKDCLCRPRYDI